MLNDIKENKIIEAEVIRVAHLASVGELAADIAHEINNSIAGIISLTEILKARCNRRGEDDDIPDRIINDGERVAEIVKDLLSFAQDRNDDHYPSQIKDVISDTLRLIDRQMIKDGTTILVDFPSDLPQLEINRQEIQQVFLNILSNARYALKLKYPDAHKDKILKINGESIKVDNMTYVRTTFFDRGSGIPAVIRDKIREPFYSSKPKGQGTGLGLSISHIIVKNHGGRLIIESKEGVYTKVMVDLPVEDEMR